MPAKRGPRCLVRGKPKDRDRHVLCRAREERLSALHVDRAYETRAREVACGQAAVAAARLANLLNAALK